jgi:hypothetical protein
MNYQDFIKNIYSSLKSINLKQEKLEEYFDTVFNKIDTLEGKIDTVSNKLNEYIDINNRKKDAKSLELSNSLNNISINLSSIQKDQNDIYSTINNDKNIEVEMNVLINDYLESEHNINNTEIDINYLNNNQEITTLFSENNTVNVNNNEMIDINEKNEINTNNDINTNNTNNENNEINMNNDIINILQTIEEDDSLLILD